LDDGDDDRYAREPEPGDVVRICRALNDAGARYLLIGGFAVIAHGAGRFTKDIDLLIDAEPFVREGVEIPVASPRTLIRLKQTARPQDALDRAFLEGVLRSRG
jgi:hypothetical protein